MKDTERGTDIRRPSLAANLRQLAVSDASRAGPESVGGVKQIRVAPGVHANEECG